MRVDGYSGLHAEGFYLLNIAMKVSAGLKMHDEYVCTCLMKIRGQFFGFLDHQMDLTGLLGYLPDMLDYGYTKTDIGDEPSVHDIEMKAVGLAFVDHPAFVFKA
jgi:hypothetical protein